MEQENRSYTATEEVTPEKTAKAVGSGELEVYATPAMLALMEKVAAACLAPLLKEGETSVGAQIGSTHLSPSPLGATVRATATLLSFDGRCARKRKAGPPSGPRLPCGPLTGAPPASPSPPRTTLARSARGSTPAPWWGPSASSSECGRKSPFKGFSKIAAGALSRPSPAPRTNRIGCGEPSPCPFLGVYSITLD